MKGIRLVGAVAIMLLVLGSGVAFAEQGEAAQASDPTLSSPPDAEPGLEIIADRTASSQTFRRDDGVRETRIFGSPINYRDAQGDWKPIEEGLEEQPDGSGLTNGSNGFSVDLPERLGEAQVRLTVGGQWVSTELLGDSSQPAQLEDREASYGLSGDAAIDYASVPNGIKESIEIAGPDEPSSFKFALDASAGLHPVLSEEGAVEFRDEDGRVVATLPAPFMYDSATPAPAESSEIHYELEPGSAGNWILKVTADRGWLSSPERVWPVYLDPTITLPTPSLDCFYGLYGTATTYNGCGSGGTPRLKTQYMPTTKEQTAERERSLLKFDTSSIPSNAHISEATVGLYAPWEPSHVTGIEVRRATKSWDKNVTWFKFDGTQSWTAAGGDFSSSEGSEILASERSNLEGWWNFSKGLAPLVEGWASGKIANQGLLVKLKSEEGCQPPSCTDSWASFNSSATTESGTRPYLSVVYSTPPTVLAKSATSVKETEATLNAGINPNGTATSYQFEYGTTTSYGKVVPASPKGIGTGTTEVAVSEALSGLSPNTTYHFRVSATNEAGTTKGEDRTFTTLKLPTTTTGGSEPGKTSATIFGQVNPNGSSTSYQFEFGPTTSYGSKIPEKPTGIGSGTSTVNAQALATGLKLGTTYHYRLTATNSAGTAFGADKVLTTLNPPDTTITSPQPTYTSGNSAPIAFSSDQSGVTFKCSFDEGEFPSKTCSSPYALPDHLSPGWHTFFAAAVNANGQGDSTPAKYVFNPAIYPSAPTTSKLTAPAEGEKTAGYYTLQAEWGGPPTGGGVTGLTFQMKLHSWDEFRPVPAECVVDGKGKQVSWPLSVTQNPGHSEPVFLKVYGCSVFASAGYPDEDIKFRAAFDGGVNAAGASEAVTTEYFGKHDGVGAPTDATEQIGPANLDLLTGNFTLSRTDVSIPVPGSEANLEFTRTYESNYNDEAVASMVLGGMWQPSAPVEQAFQGEAWSELRERHEDAVPAQYETECWEEEGEKECEEFMVEEAIPAADWIELLDNEGAAASFEIQGGNYIAPEYMKEYVLTKQGSGASATFELASPEGTHTVFVYNEVGIQGSYRPSSVSWQATAKSARMVYEHVEGTGEYHLTKMISPAPTGVKCSDTEATKTAGCRTLSFQYFKCECSGWNRLSSITYYNSSGNESQAQVVAQYEYDLKYRLIAEWDPRISSTLKETYDYDEWYKMQSFTLPAQEPWKFEYYDWHNSRLEGRLKSVSRASLLESPKTAQTTIVYEVPVSGPPYDLSPASVAEWGQSDYPVNATAIFPPTEVPGEPPSDYTQATVKYMDPDGYAVNTVSPQVPGVSGLSLSTTETDRHGNVIRSLSPQNRLLALAAGKESAVRSRQLDSQSTYSADGTEMLESLGPLHKVRLESGSTVEARAKSVIQYDQNATEPPKDTPWPHLPTTETTSAMTP